MEDIITPKIEIDTKSEILIRKAARQYNIMAVLFFLLSLAGLSINLLRLRRLGFKDYVEWSSTFNFTVMPFVFIIYILLSSFQVYYYYKAIKTQRSALYHFDQQLFGKSFEYYVWGNRLSILCMSLYFFIDMVFVYQEIYV